MRRGREPLTVGPQQLQICVSNASGYFVGRPGCLHRKAVKKYCLFPSGPSIYFENSAITNYT